MILTDTPTNIFSDFNLHGIANKVKTFPSIKKKKKSYPIVCFVFPGSKANQISKCSEVQHAKQLSFCFSWPLTRVPHGTSQLWSLPVPKEYSLSL